MDEFPISVIVTFSSLFLSGCILFVLVPLGIGYLRLWRGEAANAARVEARSQETLGILAGLIVGDMLIFILGSTLNPLPATILYPLIGGIDLLFLFFVIDAIIVERLARRRQRTEMQAEG